MNCSRPRSPEPRALASLNHTNVSGIYGIEQQQYRNQGFEIVVVDSQRDRERAVKFIEKNKLSFPCLENGEDDAEFVYDTFKVTGIPMSFLIDGNGKILFVHLGFEKGDEEKLAKEIERVLSL